MTNDEIDNLTRQLERLRLRRENAIRIVTEANEAEVNIIARIRRARAINPRRQNNPKKRGDIVTHTSHHIECGTSDQTHYYVCSAEPLTANITIYF